MGNNPDRGSLAAIKGIGISVTGYFKLSRETATALESGFSGFKLPLRSEEGRKHRFELGAISYAEIDGERVMLEDLSLAHCHGTFFHFQYSESNGPRLNKRGEPVTKVYDEDVNRILRSIAEPAAKDLRVVYYLPRVRMSIPKLREVTFRGLTLSGVRLSLAEGKNKRDSVVLDWANAKSLSATLELQRKIPISGLWPLSLLVHLAGPLATLKKAGVDYEIQPTA